MKNRHCVFVENSAVTADEAVAKIASTVDEAVAEGASM